MPYPDQTVISKKIIVTSIICFFWIVAKAMSWKVWLADRIFPIIPPLDFLQAPAGIHLALFILSLLFLLGLFCIPTSRRLLVGVIIIEVLSCSLDQNRWQPWEYNYIFILLALVINYKKGDKAANVIAFILFCIYLFSGLGKMNYVFSSRVHYLIDNSAIIHLNKFRLYNFITFHMGFLMGFIEVVLAVGLLFQKSKRISAYLLITMHLLIILTISPLVLDYDSIIIPWNLAFISILFVIFIRNAPVSIHLNVKVNRWNIIFILVFGILPIFNFVGNWDYFLSSSLFSSKLPMMYVYIHNAGKEKILLPYITTPKNRCITDTSTMELNILKWSFKEMNVPVYPEIRVYKEIKSQLLQRYTGINAEFIITTYHNGKMEKSDI